MSCAGIAEILDEEMIERSSPSPIASGIRRTNLSELPRREGSRVAAELGHRYLLRFLMESQVSLFLDGSTSLHFATPTPYGTDDCPSWLALPRPENPRAYAMLLDPSKIPVIQGPRKIRGGHGIEYVLPEGFPKEAIYQGWVLKVA